MKVYVILERGEEHEVAISKIFSNRKKARNVVRASIKEICAYKSETDTKIE